MPGAVDHGDSIGVFNGVRSESPEYVCWRNMKARCLRPSHPHYRNYGARGITVCQEWIWSFSAFLKDMGRRPSAKHTIERERNGEGYGPGNCRWAVRSDQQANRRNTRQIEVGGELLTLAEASERFGVPLARLTSRIFKLGWPVERAIAEPANNVPRKA